MASHPDRCRVFHDLHASGCFVIPNPWDVGAARALVSLGFKALATTSSGFAWSIGRPDHVQRSLAASTAGRRVVPPIARCDFR